MELLEAHGDYPSKVYKVLSELKHAENFISGSIKFGLLQSYTSIEDEVRRDITEGKAHVIYEGLSKHTEFASNSFYILSCHSSLKSAMQSKFGKYIVEINNPKKLADDITKWLQTQPHKYFGGVEGVSIKYSYGMNSDTKSTRIERAKLTYSQKPNSFSTEEEFRFVLITESSIIDDVFIELDKVAEYCKII